MRVPSLKIQDLIVVMVLYIIVIAVHGYRFCDLDLSETLSYAKYLNNPELYPEDLYIQAVSQSDLNERFPFAKLLSMLHPHYEWGVFFFHLISSLAIFWGWWHISRKYINSFTYQMAFLLVV